MKLKALSLILCGLVFTSCFAPRLPQLRNPENIFRDERLLWATVKEMEDRINKSDMLVQNEELTNYVNSVKDKVQAYTGSEELPFRVKVIRKPYLNAFALPNGAIYLHTDTLARLKNEAQLATILGHEMTHVTHRHSLKQFRSVVAKVYAAYALKWILVFVPGTDLLEFFGAQILIDIITLTSISEYSQDMESEADRVGFNLIEKAGYEVRETPKVFEILKQAAEEEEMDEPFFFASHPRLNSRIQSMQQLVARKNFPNGKIGKEKYLEKTQVSLLETIKLNLDIGRSDLSKSMLEIYTQLNPEDPEGQYWAGKAYMQGNTNTSLEKAIQQYKLIPKESELYEKSRSEIALALFRQGKTALSQAAFQDYLNLCQNCEERQFALYYISLIQKRKD